MTQPIIWHNAHCSKSRQTLQILQDRGYEPIIVDYVNAAPTKEEIKNVLDLLGIRAMELIRTSDAKFNEAGLSKNDPSDILIDAMATYSILIERPVVLYKGRAALGRPPESVLDII